MAMIWLSVKRDFFIEISPVQITRKFYLTTHRFFGGITHYQAISLLIDKPNAVRAVAAANGANRIAIVIPCHRIIGKDGGMTGYGGGISRKEWLIEHERNNV
jgi:O-6-methylguanine DNA methyltransferase